MIAVLAALLVAAGALGQSPAEAAPAATSSTPPQGIAAPNPTAPTIGVPDSGSARVAIGGTATAGASLRVLDPDHPASSLCTTTADAAGSWACTVTLGSGADQILTVRDLSHTGLADVDSRPFSILAAPLLATPSGVGVGARVQGTGYPAAVVTVVLSDGGYSTRATTTVNGSGSFAMVLPASTVPSGRYVIRATQSSAAIPAVPSSSASAPVSLVIDREAPAAPRVLHPAAGTTVSTQPVVFDGTGETGATVTTYVDSNPVCTAVVANGSWSCSSKGLLLPGGESRVQAAQRDPAGNYGAPSRATTVAFLSPGPSATPGGTAAAPSSSPGSVPPGETADPAPPSSSTAAPVAPGGGQGSSGHGGSGQTGSGQAGSGSNGSAGAGGSGSGSGSSGSGGAGVSSGQLLSEASSWTGSTGFGRTLPTLTQGLGNWSIVWALALGLVFLLLVVVPLRLAASALGGRLALHAGRLTGRNRSMTDRTEPSALSPAVAVASALALGAVLIALAAGVDDRLQYIRLVVAIALGIALVNGVGIILPTWLVGRRQGLRLRLGVSPRLLLGAVAACVATRLLDLEPPLALGVLLIAGLVDAAGRELRAAGDSRTRGIVAAAQLGSLAGLSFLSWIAHGLLPASGAGFALEITREALATVALAGLGSLIVLLVPVGTLPGRALYAWSRSTLAGLAVIGVAMAAVVYAGGPDEAFPVVPLLAGSLLFAALALGAWAWVRFVEPRVDEA